MTEINIMKISRLPFLLFLPLKILPTDGKLKFDSNNIDSKINYSNSGGNNNDNNNTNEYKYIYSDNNDDDDNNIVIII